jgi:uncharacterized protein YggU (UPF0235/DUF167 family)
VIAAAPTTRIRLRVIPGARRAGLAGRLGDRWKLRVAAPAEGGRANRAVCELLAASLGIAPADVRVVAGAASRDKLVEISGIAAGRVEAVLEAAAEGRP